MSLERLGCPTVVIVTTDFVHEAEVQRIALGMPDLHPAIITHPLSTLTDAEIDRRAAEAAAQCAGIWRGRVG